MPGVMTGWKSIAEFIGQTVNAVVNHKKEMLEAGVIFYKKYGRPPRQTVCSTEELLTAYLIEKGEEPIHRGRKTKNKSKI